MPVRPWRLPGLFFGAMKRNNFLPIVFIFLVWLALFRPFWLRGLLPIPADIISGLYYPWLDYKWGFSVGVPVKNPLMSDIPSLLYPWRSFVVDQLKNLKWPLWNPYYFGGMPLLANFQSAVFSYVNLLFLFLPKALAWSVGVMLSPLLTMLAMYFFLRQKKLLRVPSLLGGVVFALSGFEIAWMEYNVHGHTALFLPLLLLTIDNILGKKKEKYFFLLPPLVAFQIFAGYLPIVLYSLLICLAYTLYFYFLPDFKKKKIILFDYLKLGVFWFLGLTMSAIQLIPGISLVKDSIRSVDETVLASNTSFLPIKHLVTLLAPDFFGNPTTRNFFGEGFYDNFFLFVGTLSLILIFYSFFFVRKEKGVFFWLTTLLFSLVLIIKNPLGLFLERVLMLSGGVSARALFITDFSLAVLTSIGLHRFILVNKQERKKIVIPLLILGLLIAFSFLVTYKIEEPIDQLVARRNLIVPSFFFFAGVFLNIAFVKGFFSTKFVGFLYLLLISTQLLYSAGKYLSFSKPELVFPETPIIKFLNSQRNKQQEPFRVELGRVIPQNFLMPYQIETFSGYDTLLPRRMGEFFTIIQLGRVDRRISRVQLIENYQSTLFPLLNSKYVLEKKQNEMGYFRPEGKPRDIFLDPRYKLVFEEGSVQVYEDKKSLPRAFWVNNFELAEDSESMMRLLNSEIDFSKKVILEEEPALKLQLGGKTDQGQVLWRSYQPGEISFEVVSEEPGLVFLSNNYDPDWQAEIDGKETKIYRANYSFQAIPVSQGEHLIKMSYRPQSFKLGLLVTEISLGVWILAVGVFGKKTFRF